MNNNEKFLLKLIEKVDYIDCQKEQETFVFYIDELNIRVVIPYSQSSDNFSIFIEQSSNKTDGNGDFPKKIIDFSFDSIKNIKNFLDVFYKKYEKLSNNTAIHTEVDNQFESMLKLPIDANYPYNLEDITSEPCLEDIVGNKKYSIDIENFAYDYGQDFKTKPLQPLEITCYYLSGKKSLKFNKIIPAYAINDYPVLKKFAKTSSVIKNLTDLQKALDPINTFNPKSNSILNSWILDIELENNEAKKPRNKIKV